MNKTIPSRRIHILRDSVSRLIAAGEVIERPASVVRELLDNAVDAGAGRIELHIEGGGITRLRVVDDGSGMDEEDLALCYRAHATSKIHRLEDLDELESLGFRGEALSSIAACSKMTITSSASGSEARFITVHGGAEVSSGVKAGKKGTIVDVSDLFYSMPARRKFLKRPASETGLCVKTFVEKAAAFPAIEFRMFVDGRNRYSLNSTGLKTRLEDIFGTAHRLRLIEASFDGFSFTLAAGDPGAPRRDRKLLQVFVNHRRIYEYALIQALEYGYSSYSPGGYHPVCFLFLNADPRFLDVNIHPAKREVRFKNMPDIHRAVTSTLQRELSPGTSGTVSFDNDHPAPGPDFFASPPAGYRGKDHRTDVLDTFSRLEPVRSVTGEGRPYRFLGTLFGVFLLAEMGERLLFIDQHAAHERMIYNDLQDPERGRQELLVPCRFETDEDNDRNIESMKEELAGMGIELKRNAPGFWDLLSVPAGYGTYESTIADFLAGLKGTPENLTERLFSGLACKAAVKEGEILDVHAATGIIDAVLAMETPRCPHGRPIVFSLTRDYLYSRVKRT